MKAPEFRDCLFWGAVVVALAGAISLVRITPWAGEMLGSVPPSDRFPFGIGVLLIVGVPWLALLLVTLVSLGIVVVELVRRVRAAKQDRAPEA